MRLLLTFLCTVLALYDSVPAAKAEPVDGDEEAQTQPQLNVAISAAFPQSEIFGVKIVNGLPTEAVLNVENNEPAPVSVQLIGGGLWTPDFNDAQPSQLLRNLSTTVYKSEVPPGDQQPFVYKFTTELHPADLVLKLDAIVTDSKGAYYSVSAFEGNVSVVEKPISIFDPQIIFLYLILGAGFAGTAYFVYTTWISTLFPQQPKRRAGKGGERAKTSSRGTKKVDPSDQVSVAGADGPAVTSGSKAYDEAWIPQQHLKKPEARRIRSGTPSSVKTKKAA